VCTRCALLPSKEAARARIANHKAESCGDL